MNAKLIFAAAAATAFIAGAAFADDAPAAKAKPAAHHAMHHKAKAEDKYAPPAAPIPYAEMAKYDEPAKAPMEHHKKAMHKAAKADAPKS
ncbi:MAG: hypothetical protein KGL69_00255 [Alphaproteobacteria bacterium]|nr:hypothetical protein [Alphaproteobacteria bacterium]